VASLNGLFSAQAATGGKTASTAAKNVGFLALPKEVVKRTDRIYSAVTSMWVLLGLTRKQAKPTMPLVSALPQSTVR
jgi:hypothetical protein